jgi:hypothetical protein
LNVGHDRKIRCKGKKILQSCKITTFYKKIIESFVENSNMNKLKSLLQNVAIIQKKYDDLAEYSGENYNVFDILGVHSNELSHTAILTNLLDPKGKHGQKDVFLKLFLEQIENRFKREPHFYYGFLNKFDTKNATAKKEIHLGEVNFEKAEGGRVDIVITSGIQNIVIENKIYAGDQEQQLLRYKNHFESQPIIYLTLDGSEPLKNSTGGLALNTDFICCSYQSDIKEWLEKCIKEMVNKPFIRETLNQYLILIQRLTNQSNNKKMSKEIRDLITIENVDLISNLNKELNFIIKEVKQKIFSSILNYDFPVSNNNSIKVEFNQDKDGIYVAYKYFESGINKKNDKYFEAFKAIYKGKNLGSTNHSFAWYNPIGLNRYKIEDNMTELIKLYRDEKYFNEFIDKIKNEELEIREQLINKLK